MDPRKDGSHELCFGTFKVVHDNVGVIPAGGKYFLRCLFPPGFVSAFFIRVLGGGWKFAKMGVARFFPLRPIKWLPSTAIPLNGRSGDGQDKNTHFFFPSPDAVNKHSFVSGRRSSKGAV